jgi:peptide/nickel transport system substrate-binding protein
VVHSLRLFMDAKTTPAYAIYTAALAGAEKVDEHTVRLTTKYAYPAIGLVLAQVFVVPPKYWASAGAAGFGRKPVGTGPFTLAEWVKDSRIVMDRNPGYWGQAPAGIDRLIWRPVPDDTARAAGLLAGEFDLTSALSITDLPQVEADPNLAVAEAPSFRIYTISLSSLDQHPGPLHDRRVRQALNHAVDKESLIKNVLFGRGRALSGQLLRREQIGFDPEVKDYPFDPARAKALLAEAGYPDGFEIVFKFPSGRYAQDREVSEAVAGMLAKVGVRTRMTVLEPGEFLRQLRARELAPMAFVGLAPPDDPDFQVSQYRSSWRYSYVNNPKFDALIDAGAREMNPETRAATYRSLMREMHAEAPVIFLYQGVDGLGHAKRVKGFVPSGDGRIHLHGVSLA